MKYFILIFVLFILLNVVQSSDAFFWSNQEDEDAKKSSSEMLVEKSVVDSREEVSSGATSYSYEAEPPVTYAPKTIDERSLLQPAIVGMNEPDAKPLGNEAVTNDVSSQISEGEQRRITLYMNAANARMKKDDFDGAKKYCQFVLDIDSNNQQALLMMSEIELKNMENQRLEQQRLEQANKLEQERILAEERKRQEDQARQLAEEQKEAQRRRYELKMKQEESNKKANEAQEKKRLWNFKDGSDEGKNIRVSPQDVKNQGPVDKFCPRCKRSYARTTLIYCQYDGTPLKRKK